MEKKRTLDNETAYDVAVNSLSSARLHVNGHVIVSIDNKYAMTPRFLRERAFDELAKLL